MRPGRYADRPRIADLVVDGLEVEIVVPDLDARIAPVADVDVALRIGGDRVRQPKLALPGPLLPRRLEEAAILVVLDDPIVAIPVRHEDVSVLVPGDVGRPVERIRPVRIRRRALAAEIRELF